MVQYLVCRTVAVTWAMLVGRVQRLEKGASWNAPVFDETVKVFNNKAEATAYCDKMNKALHDPHRGIDIAPYTDYYVIPIGVKKNKA